jgi:hypothetical protein
MTTHRIEMTLRVLTVVFAVTGAAFWILPPSVPDVLLTAKSQTASLAINRAVAQSSDSASASAIVASNIFSPSRAAPGKRYTPPGTGGEGEETNAHVSDVPVMPPSPPPRVFGTMMGPGGATALMQTDSAGASGRLYREGERVGGYRILKISSSSVIVRGPEGRIELKIQPREDRTQ